METARVSNSELAELCGVTLQAVTGWRATGRFGRKHYDQICRRLNVTVEYLLTGRDAAPHPRSSGAETAALTQHELDVLGGYRLLPDELKTAVWTIIDAHMRTTIPGYAQAVGPRDIAKSRSIEPRLATAQIVAQSKELATQGPRSPRGKKR